MHLKTITLTAAIVCMTILAGCANDSETPPAAAKTDSPAAAPLRLAEDTRPASPTRYATAGNNPTPCTAILNTHCVVCHHATRICQKLGRKNRKGWERTISNMIGHGAQLTPAEKETLVNCLERQAPEIQEYCR